jgi:hypothetical protein
MLGLDLANLIIYILKNGEKIPKNHNFLSFQIRGKKKEIAKKKDTAPNVRSKGAWVLDGRDALH